MPNGPFALGVDVGSVSVNVAVLDDSGEVLESTYLRHLGHPNRVVVQALREVLVRYPADRVRLIGVTGTAGEVVAQHLGGVLVNEVIAQAVSTGKLYPEVRTVIDIGGEDSKLVALRPDADTGRTGVADFAMNTMCAAGTGSFLDQQASRLGLSIEDFGKMALESESPPRVAGRCSVFAKSDMIHLQQKATPTRDIVAGLCFALARNFRSTVGSSAKLQPPVSFQGGVAANPGIVRAMKGVLELEDEQFVIPEHFAAMGAIGAGLYAMAADDPPEPNLSDEALATLEKFETETERTTLPPLRIEKSTVGEGEVHRPDLPADGSRIPAYLGVDVGSISTNVVVIDEEGRVLSKRYLMTAGQPIEAVRTGLREVGEEVADLVEIRGACTTGSGRYLIADFIGADVVRNEITAQATGAASIDPEVDTIFEIGGQDSKYISLENGAVVDFEMNKVCAAGTGSFLEEQAERLGISIKEEFGELALSARHPLNLGERCTVFMETELLRHQQAGATTANLASGLAYSIVYNYLNRVVNPKPVGDRIFFQGGTAFNRAVVAAFEHVTGKPITVPPHHEVTGAIGCALIARDWDKGEQTTFRGFDLVDLTYEVTSFECRKCPNRCEINRVTIEGQEPLFYGDRCERYQTRKSNRAEGIPDLMAEREEALLHSYEPSGPLPEGAPKLGLPRALLFHEMYPLWHAFLTELGFEIVLSDPTNKQIIHEGAERSVAETCFPMKVALGHILNLLDKQIDYLFLPSVINLPNDDPRLTDSFVCPYVQSLPYTIEAAVDLEAAGIQVLKPVVYLGDNPTKGEDTLIDMGRRFGKSPRQVKAALQKGLESLARFERHLKERGAEVLKQLPKDARAIVIVSRSYNGCDPGANLEIPRKLRNMGVWAMPLDYLPIDDHPLPEEYANMYWHYGRKILAGAECICDDDRLHALYLTNFGCGPDSFLNKFFKERLGGRPCLTIEVDEHSADAGMITRCEAFLDSLQAADKRRYGESRVPAKLWDLTDRTILIPNMSGHAYALAAAFEACGQSADVLPEPDDETLHWGRQFTSGKECFPCCVTTGDMVKFVKNSQFDRDKHAFFMGGSGGPCRFGQYNTLQRMVLDELGYEDVPIFAPNQASSFYDDIGLVGRKLLRVGWLGIVALDVIEKALHELKPYEVEPGSADKAYWDSLEDICDVLKADGDLMPAMRRARERFDGVKIDRSEPKPIIGLVGEFYIRANAFSNQTLVEKLEELGAEVWSAPVYEWFLYRNFRRSMRAKLRGQWGLLVKNELKDRVMKRDEHRLVAPFADLLRNAHEPSTLEVLEYAAPYVHRSFEGEAIMTVGKAVDFARRGLSGVVAVMPFTCMPGTISYALMKRVREDEDDVPFLNMVYDGLEQATAQTRLEAFVHQAREYMQRKRASGVVAESH
jgi:predicted CoA-substrate-specific enzyme activase